MLSCYLIAKNAEETLGRALNSVKGLADELILIDDGSADRTADIAREHGATVIKQPHPSEGFKRQKGLDACHGDWVLVLDTDEEIPPDLAEEIRAIVSGQPAIYSNSPVEQNPLPQAYQIPFRNHFLGKPVNYGGEYYSQLRLFKKGVVEVVDTPIHSFYRVLQNVITGTTSCKLNHYSYRSMEQLYAKFKDYARREARRKAAAGERTGFKKLTLYPLHMFWARFIEDRGYKDGLFRIPLDIAFAYMEFMTYWNMLFLPNINVLSPSAKDASVKGGSW